MNTRLHLHLPCVYKNIKEATIINLYMQNMHDDLNGD